MRIEFTISLNPVTKKNHGQIVTVKGRPMMIPSKEYRQYEKDCEPFIPKIPKPIDYPVTVSAHFYKNTKRVCDLVNCLQALLDILVKYGVIADDNYTVVKSVDRSRVSVDRENPRTDVLITDEVDGWVTDG